MQAMWHGACSSTGSMPIHDPADQARVDAARAKLFEGMYDPGLRGEARRVGCRKVRILNPPCSPGGELDAGTSLDATTRRFAQLEID